MNIALEYKKIKRTGIIPGCLAGGLLAALIPVLELTVYRADTAAASDDLPGRLADDVDAEYAGRYHGSMYDVPHGICGQCDPADHNTACERRGSIFPESPPAIRDVRGFPGNGDAICKCVYSSLVWRRGRGVLGVLWHVFSRSISGIDPRSALESWILLLYAAPGSIPVSSDRVCM